MKGAPTGDELLDQLTAQARDPGAGTLAALIGAMAADLLARSARASTETWSCAGGAAAQAVRLRGRLGPLAGENSAAYAAALTALDSAGLGESPAGRDDDIAVALERAAEVLAAIAEASADVAELAREVAAECRPSLRPDALGAAHFANAAAGATAVLTEANLLTPTGPEWLERARAAADRATLALAHANEARP